MIFKQDIQFMRQAIELAEQGLYTTMPNPRVGCLIVREGEIVGRGAHLRAGEAHAEVYALKQAGELAQGADVYVTLEPCSHHGRTPPCANALIIAEVKRVVVAMQDPNPQVAGSGLERLQSQGIEVVTGVLEAEAEALNPGFAMRMSTGRPFVRSKIATSLDGRTALANGESQWITGVESRADVQHWRARSCAIMTGIGTVLSDNPQLNVRRDDLLDLNGGRQPMRIVVDSRLRIPEDAAILQGDNTIVAYASDPSSRAGRLQAAGVNLLGLPDSQGRVDLRSLMQHLASLEVNELLLEAGQELNGAMQQAGLIDEYLLYYAPLLMGADARGMVEIPRLSAMSECPRLEILGVDKIGSDLRVRAKPVG